MDAASLAAANALLVEKIRKLEEHNKILEENRLLSYRIKQLEEHNQRIRTQTTTPHEAKRPQEVVEATPPKPKDKTPVVPSFTCHHVDGDDIFAEVFLPIKDVQIQTTILPQQEKALVCFPHFSFLSKGRIHFHSCQQSPGQTNLRISLDSNSSRFNRYSIRI